MEFLIGLVVVICAVIFLPKILSSPETKLFRRVWSTERMSNSYAFEKQAEAMNDLASHFGINPDNAPDEVDEAIGNLLEAAVEFDLRYKNNLGVEVTSVIARNLSTRADLQGNAEVIEKLNQVVKLNVSAFGEAMVQAINSSLPQNQTGEKKN